MHSACSVILAPITSSRAPYRLSYCFRTLLLLAVAITSSRALLSRSLLASPLMLALHVAIAIVLYIVQ